MNRKDKKNVLHNVNLDEVELENKEENIEIREIPMSNIVEEKEIFQSDFLEDKVFEELQTTQKLCKAVKGLLGETEKTESFLDKINTKWHILRTETQVLEPNKVITKSIKSKITFKRICLSSILEYEQNQEKEMKAEEIIKIIASTYEGGLEALMREHEDLSDSLRLVHVEGVVGKLNRTLLTVPYNKIMKKKPPKSQMIKDMMSRFFYNLFPPVDWLKEYKQNWQSNLKGDLIAGLIVGIMAIPQGMAYAIVAGLPPIYGLYTAIFPVIIYAFTGTCRQLGVGPAAVISLLVHDSLVNRGIEELGTDEIATVALTISFLNGLIQLLLGMFRLGFIASFLSHNFMSAFTTAAATYIITTYGAFLLGLKVHESTKYFEQLVNLIRVLPEANGMTFLVGFSCMVLLLVHYFLKSKIKWLNYVPVALIVIVIGTIISYFADLSGKYHVTIVGYIPPGFPSIRLPRMDILKEVLVPSIIIGVISFIETVALGERFGKKYNYKVRPNQELVAMGVSNILGSFVGAYPSTGSFSKSALMDTAGAKSLISSIIGAVIVLLTIIFLTKPLFFLPKTILASIVIVAVLSLFDFGKIPELYKRSKIEMVVWLFSFFSTLFLGLDLGVFVAVGFSLLVVLYQVAFPDTYVLGRLPGLKTYRPVKRFPHALVHPSIAVIRIDSLICFLNVSYVKKFVKDLITKSKPQIQAIVMDWSTVSSIDITGVEVLVELIEDAKKKDILFLHAHVKGLVSDELKVCGFLEHVSSEHFFLQLHDAVMYASKYVLDFEEKNKQETNVISNTSSSENQSNSEKNLLLLSEDNEEGDMFYSPLVYANDEEVEQKKPPVKWLGKIVEKFSN